MGFQSTRPVWGATHLTFLTDSKHVVSIHAPRVGRDWRNPFTPIPISSFNPRAPCGARRMEELNPWLLDSFNPRAPCGARHVLLFSVGFYLSFNPRAPCGARRFATSQTTTKCKFQSTRPVWGATRCECTPYGVPDVSIHAPRVGRDSDKAINILYLIGFNPRAPCGARPTNMAMFIPVTSFNPRAPCGARHKNCSISL